MYQDRFPLGGLALSKWPICFSNFTQANNYSLVEYSPSWLYAKLSCEGCDAASPGTRSVDATPSPETATHTTLCEWPAGSCLACDLPSLACT